MISTIGWPESVPVKDCTVGDGVCMCLGLHSTLHVRVTARESFARYVHCCDLAGTLRVLSWSGFPFTLDAGLYTSSPHGTTLYF